MWCCYKRIVYDFVDAPKCPGELGCLSLDFHGLGHVRFLSFSGIPLLNEKGTRVPSSKNIRQLRSGYSDV